MSLTLTFPDDIGMNFLGYGNDLFVRILVSECLQVPAVQQIIRRCRDSFPPRLSPAKPTLPSNSFTSSPLPDLAFTRSIPSATLLPYFSYRFPLHLFLSESTLSVQIPVENKWGIGFCRINPGFLKAHLLRVVEVVVNYCLSFLNILRSTTYRCLVHRIYHRKRS